MPPGCLPDAFQMSPLPDASQCLQMRPDASRCAQMPPDASRCFQMLPDAFRCLPDASQMPRRCFPDDSQMSPSNDSLSMITVPCPPEFVYKETLFGVSRWGRYNINDVTIGLENMAGGCERHPSQVQRTLCELLS